MMKVEFESTFLHSISLPLLNTSEPTLAHGESSIQVESIEFGVGLP